MPRFPPPVNSGADNRLDATDLGRPVYLKRGFRDFAGDRPVGARAGSAANSRTPRDVQHSETTLESNLDALRGFDRGAAKIDRADLLAHLIRDPGVRVRTIGRAGRTSAYAVVRPGRRAMHIGPVVADAEADAVAALDALLSEQDSGIAQPAFIDVPRGRLEKWLVPAGFRRAKADTHVIGPDDDRECSVRRSFAALDWSWAKETHERRNQSRSILQLGLAFWGSKALLSAGRDRPLHRTGARAASCGRTLQTAPAPIRAARGISSQPSSPLECSRRNANLYSNTPEAICFLGPAKPSYVGGLLEMANARLYRFWGNLTMRCAAASRRNELIETPDGNPFDALYSEPQRLRQFLASMTGISLGAA